MPKEKQGTKSEKTKGKKVKEKIKIEKKEKPEEKKSETEKKPEISDEETKEIKKVEVQKQEKPEEKKETYKKKERKERIGMLNIYTTFNNTIINLTDLAGTSVAKFSGGQSTNQDRLKANPTIAMFISQRIAEEARDNGFTGFYVKIRAKTGQANPGPGAHAAIKSLTRAGFKILSIMDDTRIPRGGPKKKGGRRGRRV